MLRSFSQIHEISNLVPRVFSFSGKQEDPGAKLDICQHINTWRPRRPGNSPATRGAFRSLRSKHFFFCSSSVAQMFAAELSKTINSCFTGKAGSGIGNRKRGSTIEDEWSGIGKLKNCKTPVDRGDVGRRLWVNFTEHIPFYLYCTKH